MISFDIDAIIDLSELDESKRVSYSKRIEQWRDEVEDMNDRLEFETFVSFINDKIEYKKSYFDYCYGHYLSIRDPIPSHILKIPASYNERRKIQYEEIFDVKIENNFVKINRKIN